MTRAASASSGSRVTVPPASRCRTAGTPRSPPRVPVELAEVHLDRQGVVERRRHRRDVRGVATHLHRAGRLRGPELGARAIPAQRRLAGERDPGPGRRDRLVAWPHVARQVEAAGHRRRPRWRRRPPTSPVSCAGRSTAGVRPWPRPPVSSCPKPAPPRVVRPDPVRPSARRCPSIVSPARVSAAYAALISAIRRVARRALSGSSPVRSGYAGARARARLP